MACGVSQLERLVTQVVVVGEEHAAAVKEEAVVETPGRLELTGTQALQHLLCVRRPYCRLAHCIEECEGRARADAHGVQLRSGVLGVLCVATRESVGHRVKPSRTVLHGEVEAEELADPLVLRHCGQALVQQVLQTEVVGVGAECSPDTN
jgi:hypothetical protein